MEGVVNVEWHGQDYLHLKWHVVCSGLATPGIEGTYCELLVILAEVHVVLVTVRLHALVHFALLGTAVILKAATQCNILTFPLSGIQYITRFIYIHTGVLVFFVTITKAHEIINTIK